MKHQWKQTFVSLFASKLYQQCDPLNETNILRKYVQAIVFFKTTCIIVVFIIFH